MIHQRFSDIFYKVFHNIAYTSLRGAFAATKQSHIRYQDCFGRKYTALAMTMTVYLPVFTDAPRLASASSASFTRTSTASPFLKRSKRSRMPALLNTFSTDSVG